MAMERDRTVVAIIGHSYVSRLEMFASEHEHHNIRSDLNLRQCEVHWLGNRGGKVKKVLRYDLMAIDAIRPDVAIVHLGGNELDNGDDPETVAASLVHLAGRLKDHGCQLVYLCSVLPRPRPKFSSQQQFQTAADHFNDHLKIILDHRPGHKQDKEFQNIKFWQHRRFRENELNVHDRDGVHLNDLGQKRLYYSIRQAAYESDKRLRTLNN